MMFGHGSHYFEDSSTRQSRGCGTARVAVVGLALGLLLTSCGAAGGQKGPAFGPSNCEAPAGARVQDIDPDDSPVKSWQKPAGAELVVEFETDRLSERYAGMVTEAATIWSKSSCVDAVAVQTCSDGANCVSMEEDSGRSRNSDGEMSWQSSGGYMQSASIILYTMPLEQTTDNGVLATIVHEMGHALGLDHRLERSDVMNSVTGNNTNPVPDSVDFANLAAIYGS